MKAAAGLVALSILIAGLAGCAREPSLERLGDPPAATILRIAVLPAMPAPAEEGGEFPDLSLQTLAEMRECLTLQLPRETFDVISLPRVDQALAAGDPLPREPGEIASLARQLGARVVVLPELFAWDRRYYVVHSVARVGLRVSLFDGESGAPLFRSSREDVRNQGLLKIPTGYGGAAYGPIRGVLHFQMQYLCDRVAHDVAQDLTAFAGSAPEEPPAPAAPVRRAVISVPPVFPAVFPE